MKSDTFNRKLGSHYKHGQQRLEERRIRCGLQGNGLEVVLLQLIANSVMFPGKENASRAEWALQGATILISAWCLLGEFIPRVFLNGSILFQSWETQQLVISGAVSCFLFLLASVRHTGNSTTDGKL